MNRNKSLFFSLLFIFSFAPNLFSQEIAPFQLDDSHAKTIDEGVLSRIVGENWVCTNRKFTKGNTTTSHKIRLSFNINENGTFSQNNKEGDWSVEDNLLNFQVELYEFQNNNVYMAGGFSVYRSTKEELILAKNLSSKFDNKIVYYFELEEKVIKRRRALALQESSNPLKKTSSFRPPVAEQPMQMPNEKFELISDLRSQLFMRKLDGDKMTVEELKKMWKKYYAKENEN